MLPPTQKAGPDLLRIILIFFMFFVGVDCGALNPPANGSVSTVDGSTLYGAVATYTCNTMEGYVMSGTATRSCQTDAKWEGQDTTCQSMS